MRNNRRHDDEVRETPSAVVAAVALGTAPLPFLAVYTVLFLVHGTLKPVHPADITSSQTGEAIAGVVTLAVFVVQIIALLWLLNGTRRWPYLVMQAGIGAVAVDLLFDSTASGPVLCLILALTSFAGLGLALTPPAWAHVGRTMPRLRGRTKRPATAPAPQSAPPTAVEPAALRNRRSSGSGG